MPPVKSEAALRKEIAEVILEASAFIDRWKDQECAASDAPSELIKDRDITRTLRLLEGLVPHMLGDDARRLEEFIETIECMLNSTEWRSPPRLLLGLVHHPGFDILISIALAPSALAMRRVSSFALAAK